MRKSPWRMVTKLPETAGTFLVVGRSVQLSPRAAPLGTLTGTPETRYICLEPVAPETVSVELPEAGTDVGDEQTGHATAGPKTGYISWYDFCVEIYRQYGLTTKVTPVTTAEYGLSKAARPYNSRLDKKKLVENGFTPLPVWTDAVRRYLEEAEL